MKQTLVEFLVPAILKVTTAAIWHSTQHDLMRGKLSLPFRWIACAIAVTLYVISPGHSQAAEAPINIIFDSDVDQDCDDIGALFILHGAIERGEANLLATMGCTSSNAIAPCLDSVNTWFGRPEIPVGTLKDKGLLDHKGFADEVILRYPNKHLSGDDYPDAVALYRQVLAKQPDGSVVILAVGPLRNIANLLRSQPDSASPLDGKALVAQKVKRLDVMGGTYPPSSSSQKAEWNFEQDPASAALVCSAWPTPILFNGEGGSTNSGRRVTYEMPEHNPLTMAYRLFPGVGYAGDRLSWDPISALVAIRGAKPWFEVVSGGRNDTDPITGVNTWKAESSGHHSYLVLKVPKHELETDLEDLMTSGKSRPQHLQFNTIYYADDGMCRVTFDGERSKAGEWLNRAASGQIEYQHVDDRQCLVTSYALTCNDPSRCPSTIELLGSNDGGVAWTRLDYQPNPGFTAQVRRREFKVNTPSKWNIYRLRVMANDAQPETLISTIELLESIHGRPGVSVSSLGLNQSKATVSVNGRLTLVATTMPLESFEREIIWSCNNPNVAAVRRIGEQSAMLIGVKPGECMVTATIEGVTVDCRVTVLPTTLPAIWQYDELRSPAIPGAVSVSNGEFKITGCGHAMTSWWERVRDQGVFISQRVSDDVKLSARITSIAPDVGGGQLRPWDYRPPSAAGLMIRESLDQACGRYVLFQVEASGNLVCRWRDKSGDQDDNQRKDLGKVSLPIYLKLVRTDQRVQLFTSDDGAQWGEPRMTHTTTLEAFSRIGLFVCSGNTFASTSLVADNVMLSE